MAGALTAMVASIFSGGVAADPFFEYTTLLLPGNGTNGQNNNTFLDGSTNNFTITRNGNTTQGTFSPFSQTGWGNYFDGGNKYLSFAGANTANAMGTGDWTFEAWLYPTTSGTDRSIFDTEGQGTITTALRIRLGTSNQLILFVGGVVASGGNVPANTWTHVAICKSSGSTRLFVNGSQVGSTYSDSNNYTCGVNRPITCVDGYDSSTINYYGFISNLRVVKGQGLFTGTFTPSNLPLGLTTVGSTGPGVPTQNITGTVSLLTCQSNRFKDNSTNNFATTVNGNPSVVAFSPFNPTASWSAATYGGSGYFDGSGDYVQANGANLAVGTGDFTLECYVYTWVFSGDPGIMQIGPSAYAVNTPAYTNSIGMSVTLGGNIFFYNNGSYTTGNVPIQAYTWNHLAICRSGTTHRLFVNGVQAASVTDSSNYTGQFFGAGVGYGTNFPFTGYITNVRLLRGTALYTAAFTPPAAPLTAITNTSLLLNFTNAGIYDATSKNDLETVGNAQISTAQYKFPPSSMAFDGTGDYLLIPDNPSQRIGTGNFTVECWVYRNASGTYGLIGKGTGTTGWLLSLNSSNQVVFTYGSSTITSTGTISATTWTHIAVVRSGTGANQTKIYIGGTNDGTGTVSTDFNQTNAMYVAADRTGGSNANAYVQDTRVTLYARYSANFTPPTAAFPVQ